MRDAIRHVDLCATDEASDRFGEKQIALHIFGQAVAAKDFAAAGRGEMVERFILGPEAVQAIPNGRARFTYTLTVDGRLEKGFRVGRRRVAAILESFNVLGMANEVEEDVTQSGTTTVTFLAGHSCANAVLEGASRNGREVNASAAPKPSRVAFRSVIIASLR